MTQQALASPKVRSLVSCRKVFRSPFIFFNRKNGKPGQAIFAISGG